MKKQKEIFVGITFLVLGFILGIVLAVIIVECDIPSRASNDGWLGFLGGLIGSLLSGLVTFFILYVNRKDAQRTIEDNKKETDKIQSESRELANRNLEQQLYILKYQAHMAISDDIMKLIAELTCIAEDYYVNVCDNTYRFYEDKIYKSREICRLLKMKLHGIDEADNLLHKVRNYQHEFLEKKPPYMDIAKKLKDVRRESEYLHQAAEEFCIKFKDIKLFNEHIKII